MESVTGLGKPLDLDRDGEAYENTIAGPWKYNVLHVEIRENPDPDINKEVDEYKCHAVG